jgi:osmoprotectant transport system ATP-binding protein
MRGRTEAATIETAHAAQVQARPHLVERTSTPTREPAPDQPTARPHTLVELKRKPRLAREAAWGAAACLVFDKATKVYGGGVAAVDHLSLLVPAGDICVLVGPSGGGKTTALRLVNRLIDLTSGDIRIDGRSVKAIDATELRRSIGYVIQQAGLFPHQTIETNIGTVPRLYGRDRKWIRRRSRELLELVGLDQTYAKRYPAQLSGGERQRVGLARAIAADPPIMLHDEPFGAIDPIVRARLQDEFLRLQREVRKTVLFVTHDIDEAIKLGDRIAILRSGGRLAQYDSPETILKSPADDFVANFVGRDRALKALELHTLAELALRPTMDGIRLPATTPLREALSALIADHASVIAVTGEDGNILGSVTRDDLLQ